MLAQRQGFQNNFTTKLRLCVGAKSGNLALNFSSLLEGFLKLPFTTSVAEVYRVRQSFFDLIRTLNWCRTFQLNTCPFANAGAAPFFRAARVDEIFFSTNCLWLLVVLLELAQLMFFSVLVHGNKHTNFIFLTGQLFQILDSSCSCTEPSGGTFTPTVCEEQNCCNGQNHIWNPIEETPPSFLPCTNPFKSFFYSATLCGFKAWKNSKRVV